MKILLTNDDGIESPGILSLEKTLAGEHEIWTMAPDSERSGMSHSITLKEAVRIQQVGERRFSCSGTPADCVLFSFLGAIPVTPDVVISGINLGPNLGTDIIYSGTAAAARQGALMGRPSIAVSVTSTAPPFFFDRAADFVLRNLDIFVSLWNEDHFLNINVPNSNTRVFKITVTHPSRRIYRDQQVNFTAPEGEKYYFLKGSTPAAGIEENSDWDAINKGNISVCPVYLHPLNHTNGRRYRDTIFREPV
ncbi:MAG: 5'/3'-nucleotidase SurE [Spirochaetota bacterium]